MRQTRVASRSLIVLAVLALLTIGAGAARADNDARDYVAAPPGTFLMITYFKHTTASKLYNDGDKVSREFNLSQNVVIFRPVYYTKLGPFVIDPQCLIIAGEAHLDGDLNGDGIPDDGDLSTSGFSDPVLLATIWFLNDAQSQTWLGFTPFLTIPIGEYDDKKPLNIGNNRWAFKPEIGFVKGFGKTYLDLTAAYEMYGDNDDPFGGQDKLEQDGLLTLEVHLSHDITKSFYVAADYFYHFGGETTLDGVDQNNEQDNHALQATLGFGIADNYQLLIQYRNDFIVDSGPKVDTFGARFLYAF
jgi:hypothetical protein